LSSILDSLKKLEKETAQQDQLPTHAGMDGKAVAPKRVIYLIGVICLLVTAVGLTFYFQGKPRTPPESPAGNKALETKPAAASDEPETSLAPPQAAPDPLPAQPMESDTTVVAAVPVVKSSDYVSATKPMPTEGIAPQQNVIQASEEQPAALKEPPKEEPVKDTAISEPEPLALATEEDIARPPEALPQTAPTEKKDSIQIDPLEGVGFKIQAISWSEIPEQSLAVINSQVLREGDGIEGYQIQRINPDDIILQRGGKAFRLDFRSTGSP
jgi:hypothetical protein